jgi:glycolate oxidase FAD binding subunit
MSVALQELRERVVEAHGRRAPLRLRGAGTKDFYGEHCEGQLLDLCAWSDVVDYEPSELVITARCGTRLSAVQALLAQHQQYLPFDPPKFGGDPTLGGIVAAGLSGPARARAGAVRDFVLGAVLLGVDGESLHFGGKVIKNVAGFDVSRLLCGSLGILGPILEVSLKVLPLPRAQQTLCFEFDQSQALRHFAAWSGQPLPVIACAWVQGRAWVHLCGTEAALRAAQQQLGGERVDRAPADAWWRSVRDQTHAFFADATTLWRLSLPSTAPTPALDDAPFIEWSGALRWYRQPHPAVTMRTLAQSLGGSALHWRGGVAGERFHPLPAALLCIHERLKAQFDPHRIFNRGRLLPQL